HQIVGHLEDTARDRGDDAQRVILLLGGAALWTASFAASICLALIAGQHHYLRGSLLTGTQFALGVGGGALAGVGGGAVGQFCFCFAPQDFISNCLVRIFAWALLGGLVGIGVTFFIPNMQRLLGLAGGTVGGGAGCVLFLMASFVAGDIIGRIIGGTVL